MVCEALPKPRGTALQGCGLPPAAACTMFAQTKAAAPGRGGRVGERMGRYCAGAVSVSISVSISASVSICSSGASYFGSAFSSSSVALM